MMWWLLISHPLTWLQRIKRLLSKAPGCTWSRWKIRRIGKKAAKLTLKYIQEDYPEDPLIKNITKNIILNGKD